MKFSIVTPSFNSIHTVRETLESVARQDYPDLEHIVMDGGSTDGTLDVVRQFPNVHWESEKDEGHYHAMNKGVIKATGDIIAILNSDDCYRPGALSIVAKAFKEHPDWDGLFGDLVYVDERGNEIYRREEAVFDYDVLRYGLCYVIHPTLFVRKAVHDRLGLYRHKDYYNSCDFEFILRLGRAKCRIGHVPELLVNYRYHEHGQSADLRVTRNMKKEGTKIRRDHGVPSGITGKIMNNLMRLKRQVQKLIYRGKCDLIPGTFILRKHMRPRTSFKSNIPIEKL
jgi:glycosyltransferase involved in cell wall biosynthesis